MKFRDTLEPGEHVITCNRAHPLKLLRPAIVVLVAIFLVNLLQVVTANYPGWSAVGPILMIAALVYVAVRLIKWLTTGYSLTNRRIVVFRGLGGGRPISIPLEYVAGVVGPKGTARLTGCGTIRISAQGQTFELTYQKEPNRFSALCYEAHLRRVNALRWP
ncbi:MULTISPECIES: PH domain-containing protein [Micrococcaceae]|uniref:PH domain-containing protein n=1 Tax=unclassified Kocuria TaxID=2649579 RepID=UPI0013ED700A|nr:MULTISPECIES: PH domain-containing protein [unclassified Kocuria]